MAMPRSNRFVCLKSILIASFLALLLSLALGCAMMLTPQLAQHMTAEQIKAYKEQNADVYSCLSLGGPPPIGATTFIVVPHGSKMDLSFAPNCGILVGKVSPGT